MSDPISCPKCAFVNRHPVGINSTTCPKCGVIYSKALPPRQVIPKKLAKPSRAIPALKKALNTPHMFTFIVPLFICAFGGLGLSTGKKQWEQISWLLFITGMAWIGLVIWAQSLDADSKKKAAEIEKRRLFLATDGYTAENVVWDDKYVRGIVIDPHQNIACLYNFAQATSRKISFRDILSVDLYEDGESISTTGGGSGIGRAIVGRALFGIAGEIIGGTTGKRTTHSQSYVDVIELRLSIKDIRDPTWDMRFLSFRAEKHTALYQNAAKQARNVVAGLNAAIAIAHEQHG